MPTILDKIVAFKRTEIEACQPKQAEFERQAEQAPAPRDFIAALKGAPTLGLIAEVKKASPSQGVIRADFDPVAIAQTYQASGANCISVLTDEHFFQGSIDYLKAIRATVDLPLLRKDFILDPCQIFEARAAGADAVLLIAECLEPEQLRTLHQLTCDLGMTPLVELYREENIESVLSCDPRLVGVNNRDLATFEVDLQHSVRIKKRLPPGLTMVSESGIATCDDVRLLQSEGVDAILVGESLMRAPHIGDAVVALMGTR